LIAVTTLSRPQPTTSVGIGSQGQILAVAIADAGGTSDMRKMGQNRAVDPSEIFDFRGIRKIDKFQIISGCIKRNLEF